MKIHIHQGKMKHTTHLAHATFRGKLYASCAKTRGFFTNIFVCGVVGLMALLNPCDVLAQSSDSAAFPNKPLRFLVGFPPGQASDGIARIFAEKLSVQLGQPVIVENRPGQGGSLAAAALKRAAPDGYTFGLMATAALATNPHLYKSVGYDSLSDFQPVAMLAQGPLYLVTNMMTKFANLKELIAFAKANPGKLNYCSSGNGTLSHLAMELLKKRAGVSLVHIAYQGSAKGMTDLSSGSVDVCFETGTAVQPHLTIKRARLLAVASLQRHPLYPDLPTLAESGYPGFEVAPYVGVVLPAGTPKAIIDRFNAELVKIGQMPEVRAQIAAVGTSINVSTPDAFAAQIKGDNVKWRTLITDLKLSIE